MLLDQSTWRALSPKFVHQSRDNHETYGTHVLQNCFSVEKKETWNAVTVAINGLNKHKQDRNICFEDMHKNKRTWLYIFNSRYCFECVFVLLYYLNGSYVLGAGYIHIPMSLCVYSEPLSHSNLIDVIMSNHKNTHYCFQMQCEPLILVTDSHRAVIMTLQWKKTWLILLWTWPNCLLSPSLSVLSELWSGFSLRLMYILDLQPSWAAVCFENSKRKIFDLINF